MALGHFVLSRVRYLTHLCVISITQMSDESVKEGGGKHRG